MYGLASSMHRHRWRRGHCWWRLWLSRHRLVQWCCLFINRYRDIYMLTYGYFFYTFPWRCGLAPLTLPWNSDTEVWLMKLRLPQGSRGKLWWATVPRTVLGGVEFELFFGSSCYRGRAELWLAWPVHFYFLFFSYLDLIWLGCIFSPFWPNRGCQLQIFFFLSSTLWKLTWFRYSWHQYQYGFFSI
jgi:hypothetical protein